MWNGCINIVLCLEYNHKVECSRNTKWHTIRERTLTDWIDQKYSRSSCYRSRICNSNPRTHT